MTTEHTTAEAAAHFGVTTATIRRWIRTEKLAAVKVGRRWAVDVTAHVHATDAEKAHVEREALAAWWNLPRPTFPHNGTAAQVREFEVVKQRQILTGRWLTARLTAVGAFETLRMVSEYTMSKGLPGGVHAHRVRVAERHILSVLGVDAVVDFDRASAGFAREDAATSMARRLRKAAAGLPPASAYRVA